MKGVYLRCTFHVAIAATAAGWQWEVDVPDLLFLLPVVIMLPGFIMMMSL
jgi:hypothetical protein